jgi:hypothetical protein
MHPAKRTRQASASTSTPPNSSTSNSNNNRRSTSYQDPSSSSDNDETTTTTTYISPIPPFVRCNDIIEVNIHGGKPNTKATIKLSLPNENDDQKSPNVADVGLLSVEDRILRAFRNSKAKSTTGITTSSSSRKSSSTTNSSSNNSASNIHNKNLLVLVDGDDSPYFDSIGHARIRIRITLPGIFVIQEEYTKARSLPFNVCRYALFRDDSVLAWEDEFYKDIGPKTKTMDIMIRLSRPAPPELDSGQLNFFLYFEDGNEADKSTLLTILPSDIVKLNQGVAKVAFRVNEVSRRYASRRFVLLMDLGEDVIPTMSKPVMILSKIKGGAGTANNNTTSTSPVPGSSSMIGNSNSSISINNNNNGNGTKLGYAPLNNWRDTSNNNNNQERFAQQSSRGGSGNSNNSSNNNGTMLTTNRAAGSFALPPPPGGAVPYYATSQYGYSSSSSAVAAANGNGNIGSLLQGDPTMLNSLGLTEWNSAVNKCVEDLKQNSIERANIERALYTLLQANIVRNMVEHESGRMQGAMGLSSLSFLNSDGSTSSSSGGLLQSQLISNGTEPMSLGMTNNNGNNNNSSDVNNTSTTHPPTSISPPPNNNIQRENSLPDIGDIPMSILFTTSASNRALSLLPDLDSVQYVSRRFVKSDGSVGTERDCIGLVGYNNLGKVMGCFRGPTFSDASFERIGPLLTSKVITDAFINTLEKTFRDFPGGNNPIPYFSMSSHTSKAACIETALKDARNYSIL